MKWNLTILILVFFIITNGQNLVINASFENYTLCPNGLSTPGFDKVANATGWTTFRDTPDYFNSCAPISSNANVPDNFFGYQYASTGNAYCGLFTYMTGGFRESMGSQLTSPLSIGLTYYISLKVNRGDKSIVTVASNKIGVLFSTVPFTATSPSPVNNFAHIYSNIIINDTTNWVTISGSFIADSTYKYIIIGNFFDDTNTNTLIVGTSPFRGYYFIDDVCVSTSSVTCNVLNNVNENYAGENFKIYPNPSTHQTTIEFNNSKKINYTLKLFDIEGRPVRIIADIISSRVEIERKDLTNGIYFFQLQSDNERRLTGKIILE